MEGGGRERERGRERGRTSGLSLSVRFFFPLILFHVMGLVLRRRNGTERNTLLLSLPQALCPRGGGGGWREGKKERECEDLTGGFTRLIEHKYLRIAHCCR